MTMKKTYINPTINDLCAEADNILTVTSVTIGEGQKDGSEAVSRRGSFTEWEDDDDYEE